MHVAEGVRGRPWPLLAAFAILFLSGCVLPRFPWQDWNNGGSINFNAPQQLPPATVGEPYAYSFCQPDAARSGAACGGIAPATNPTGGKPPYSMIYGEGIHAPGITLQLNGLYLGTPTMEGTYSFSVCARDSFGTSACEPVSIRVDAGDESNACASRSCESWQACDQAAGRCIAKTGFCNGNAECGQGRECDARAHTCRDRGGPAPTPSPGTGGTPSCPSGYVLGGDGLCHTECGHGFYCSGDSQCYNAQCIGCQQGYYLAADGLCYSDSAETYTCPQGYVLGEDFLCHEECGQNSYCDYGAQCYNGECLTCPPGDYLGIDGYCYGEGAEQYWCPDGYDLAADGYCYPAGGGDETYQCPGGYVYGEDGLCHPECGSGHYCTGDSQCCGGECISCSSGSYLAADCNCHPESSCDPGYVLGSDGLCYPGCGSGTYCTGDSQCCGGECVGCNPGYYLATDCNCYPESSCNPGYVEGSDGYCYPECGSGYYCTGNSQCCGGECISCSSGSYLATDCNCYPESSCNPGYVLGSDGYCYPECGYGTYCTGSYQCCGGQCLSCPGGSYLATDCNCYSESSCPGGYVLGYDDMCHPECGYGTYCTGGQCCGGQCISCPGGYYLAVDCLCYPYG